MGVNCNFYKSSSNIIHLTIFLNSVVINVIFNSPNSELQMHTLVAFILLSLKLTPYKLNLDIFIIFHLTRQCAYHDIMLLLQLKPKLHKIL